MLPANALALIKEYSKPLTPPDWHTRSWLCVGNIYKEIGKYSFNYGFVPNTLSEDKDPLDVVVLIDEELIPGCYIKCKILGYLETKDDEGNDPKLIACPISKIDPTYKLINDISNVEAHTLNKIKYFFTHYKDLENKHVDVGSFKSKEQAVQIYDESIQRYNSSFTVTKNETNKITNYFPLC